MSNSEQLSKLLIIAKWENDNFKLGTLKREKLLEKPMKEMIVHLDSISNIPAIIRFEDEDE